MGGLNQLIGDGIRELIECGVIVFDDNGEVVCDNPVDARMVKTELIDLSNREPPTAELMDEIIEATIVARCG